MYSSHPPPVHPFSGGARPPTDSVISDGGELKRSHAHKREHRPESEAMSRGIAPPPNFPFFGIPMQGYPGLPMGMMGPPLPEKSEPPPSHGVDTPVEVSSPGMGTFGREASHPVS